MGGLRRWSVFSAEYQLQNLKKEHNGKRCLLSVWACVTSLWTLEVVHGEKNAQDTMQAANCQKPSRSHPDRPSELPHVGQLKIKIFCFIFFQIQN